MAVRQSDGSIKLSDGRVLYANSLILGQDLAEVIPLFTPPPAWPFVSGGGSGGGQGVIGRNGAQGAQGPAGGGGGSQGPQGDLGPQGFQGTNPGPQGNQGDFGPQGFQGNQGVSGTGTQGNQGIVGPQGAQGNQGLTGAGVQGNQGNQGVVGPQGNQGALGPQGNIGPQGNQGVAGAQGNQGAVGPQGNVGAQGNQGPLGPQGNQGTAGAQGNQGAIGPQGNIGPQGFQGNDGVQGNQGNLGPQGNQGFQGSGGAGAQGPQGLQGFQGDGIQGAQGPQASDIFAATRVVSLIAGDGTDLTVAAAIAALPAEGGRIYVKQGTYVITTSITMPDKSVDIVGSGDGTIFDLGNIANTPVFIIPDGLTARRNYTFSHFKVTSNSRTGSGIVSIQDSNAFGVVTLQSVNSTGLRQPIEITDGDAAFLTPVFVDVHDCWFQPSDTYFTGPGAPLCVNCGMLVQTNGISNLMNVSFYNTKFMVDEFSTIGGTISGDSFGNLDVAFYDCDLSLVGEDGLSTIHAERCRIWNFSGTPNITFINGNFVSSDYLPTSAFINCNVLGMWLIDAGGITVEGGWWTNSRIEATVINGRSSCQGVTFRGDGTSAATFPVTGGITAFIGGSSCDFSIAGCTFSTTFAITAYIYNSSDLVITGCAFRGLTGASTAGIRINGVNNFVHHCDFDTDNWGCPPVLEVAPADRNIYNDCFGLNGNPNPLVGGAGVASVFVGVRNTFNGLSQFQATAATTDAFVEVTTQLATSGVQGIATIKNTGANGMNVRETGVDQFGTTSTQTTLVAAGNDLRLDPTVNVGTARPPYKSYKIEVQSAVAGNPTTYVLRLGMNGEVTW